MFELISLNIQGSKLLQFTIDGPALRMKRAGEATRWFPLRRIRQVCITGEPATGMDTLFKLAEKRIPVTLFSASGKLRCQLLHPDTQVSELLQLLEEAEHDIALEQAHQSWYEHHCLQAYARVGASRGCSKLAHQIYTQGLGEVLNEYDLKDSHRQAADWMHGISQSGINRLLDEYSIPLHGKYRSLLHHQLSKIAWPLEQQAALRWLVHNQGLPATPANLHRAMGELEQELLPWFSRCMNQLLISLEQASYTPTLAARKRRHA